MDWLCPDCRRPYEYVRDSVSGPYCECLQPPQYRTIGTVVIELTGIKNPAAPANDPTINNGE